LRDGLREYVEPILFILLFITGVIRMTDQEQQYRSRFQEVVQDDLAHENMRATIIFDKDLAASVKVTLILELWRLRQREP
jgi:hypothetical protein